MIFKKPKVSCMYGYEGKDGRPTYIEECSREDTESFALRDPNQDRNDKSKYIIHIIVWGSCAIGKGEYSLLFQAGFK